MGVIDGPFISKVILPLDDSFVTTKSEPSREQRNPGQPWCRVDTASGDELRHQICGSWTSPCIPTLDEAAGHRRSWLLSKDGTPNTF